MDQPGPTLRSYDPTRSNYAFRGCVKEIRWAFNFFSGYQICYGFRYGCPANPKYGESRDKRIVL